MMSNVPKKMNKDGVLETDWGSIDTKLDYSGHKIVLPGDPEKMPIDAAISTLMTIKKQESQKYDVVEKVEGAPFDALVALNRAIQDIHGVVLAQSRQTFFGEVRPDLVTINTGPGGETTQVVMGDMIIPNFPERITIGMTSSFAYLKSTVTAKDRELLQRIAGRARELIRSHSIYKGKAIRYEVDDDGSLTMRKQPEFLDLKNVSTSDLIHTDETQQQIAVNIFSPLQNTAACRKHGIPLKRGILLEGPYGTGKSLTARVTAKVATDEGWTFIMIDRSQGLKAALEFARNYQPCVIFAEDIDRSADREEESVNDLVNLLDGVPTKNVEIMVVLTTNFVDKIDKALLRPGRFDAVISIKRPDAKTVVRLIQHYGGDLLDGGDISEVGEILAGNIPATISEIVSKSKLAMLIEDRKLITVDDLRVAAVGMRAHLALLEDKPPEKSVGDRLAEALHDAVHGQSYSDQGHSATQGLIKGATSRIMSAQGRMSDQLREVGEAAAAAATSSNLDLDETKRVREMMEAKAVDF